ncbi:MAG: SCP2 sterol-binding domain-containing protein [Candidatus Thiodiazotropha sp. (ex. Lucinisca nassula)]|nr:SCP2 sterol-binding domain-containing protein [Candidatus Thiodiazotropha sp. (ex. Lucinisca nassula)]MBW9271119.1 SCP2 sterol-binding domain-containing protein [Candidatus Thiodiazotropha sp. (ex. Lucinisca nassula)]
MTITAALFASLEQLLNQAINMDPEAAKRLAPMQGRVIQLDLLGTGLNLYMIPEPQGFQVLSHFEGEADCLLRGSLLDLASMRNPSNSSDQLFSGSVTIEGDTALAQRFGEFFSSLDIDWEEQLSRLTGDVAAHQIGSLARGFLGWGKQLNQTTSLNLKEYLEEELRLIPGRYEMDLFLQDVDRLRDDVERLEARIQRLSHREDQEDKTS